jgi:hypothetical protein
MPRRPHGQSRAATPPWPGAAAPAYTRSRASTTRQLATIQRTHENAPTTKERRRRAAVQAPWHTSAMGMPARATTPPPATRSGPPKPPWHRRSWARPPRDHLAEAPPAQPSSTQPPRRGKPLAADHRTAAASPGPPPRHPHRPRQTPEKSSAAARPAQAEPRSGPSRRRQPQRQRPPPPQPPKTPSPPANLVAGAAPRPQRHRAATIPGPEPGDRETAPPPPSLGRAQLRRRPLRQRRCGGERGEAPEGGGGQGSPVSPEEATRGREETRLSFEITVFCFCLLYIRSR